MLDTEYLFPVKYNKYTLYPTQMFLDPSANYIVSVSSYQVIVTENQQGQKQSYFIFQSNFILINRDFFLIYKYQTLQN